MIVASQTISPVKYGQNLAINGVFLIYLFLDSSWPIVLGKKVLEIFSGRTFFIGGVFSLNNRNKWTKKIIP